MNSNPYEPPQAPNGLAATAEDRTPFVLAAAGAGLASVYWAVLTLLIGLGVAKGAGPAKSLFFPCILIVLYAVRGYQLYKGDPKAVVRILWLHGVGVVVAILQARSGVLVVFQTIKVLIHIFGGVTAFLAHRAIAARQGARSPERA